MSIVAIAAPLVALLGLILATLGVAAAHWGWISSVAGFLLFAFVGMLACGVLGAVLGLVGILRTRPGAHRSGAAQAWAGLLLGLAMIGLLALLTPPRAPAIHDITTDPEEPPAFVALRQLPANRDRDLGYPNGAADTAAQQREAYPDLQPIEVEMTPPAALRAVAQVAAELGWDVIEIDEPEGRLEAVDTTSVFRFRDDIVVRLRDRGTTTRIDVRSTSRDGVSDLGANADRIRTFRTALTRQVRAGGG